jgi:ParB family chromosome partitioning protein
MPPAPEEETEEEAAQRRAEHEQRMAEYAAEQQRREEERRAEYERQQREYEAEVAKREEAHKARVSTLERIVTNVPAMFTTAQLRTFLRLLLNVSPYGLFEDVAEFFVGEDENHDKTDEEILMAVLESLADDKLTGFALRLVLTDHLSIARDNERDWLAEAEAAFATSKPKSSKPRANGAGKKAPRVITQVQKKGAEKKKKAA